MHIHTWGLICAIVGTSSIATMHPAALPGQRPSAQADTARVVAVKADSVSAVAGAQYAAGAFHRWLAGDGYRDLWTQSVRVPVLDLHSFAGGLHPLKEGGGMQTKNLRLETKDGEEYVFRLVDKKATGTPPEFRSTPLNWFFQDGVSASHPGASELAAPILTATGVLHPTAVLMWMPDDPALGEFRRDFGNKLGMIEEYPSVPKGPTEVAEKESKVKGADDKEAKDAKGEKREKEREAGGKLAKDTAETRSDIGRADSTKKGDEKPNTKDENKAVGFGGATKIIDSPELLKLLNTEAKEHVDAPAFLMARLSDFLINDNDRHAGQWKWAQLAAGPKMEWEPIARDRDHAFVSYGGFENVIARFGRSSLVGFNGRVNVAGLTSPNDLDGRLLAGLEKPVWDSVARELQRRVTDSVIHAATLAMPAEYRATAPHLEAVLRQRRDAIPAAADEYYRALAARIQVHGTDSPDRASVVRAADGSVAVHLESRGKAYFSRTFHPNETHEVLVYLHDGNDTAVVSGSAPKSILVRVVGGNGDNTLVDSSVVGGSSHPTRFYNTGRTQGIEYGLDTLFERLPWEHRDSRLVEPIPNFGSAFVPVGGLSDDRSIGITPRLGVERYTYGFMDRPYASMLKLNVEYAPFWGGGRITFIGDRRFESNPLHTMLFARVSDIQFINYHGLGNATSDSTLPDTYFETRNRQWMINPSIGLALGSWTDINIGPVVQHVTTDTARSPLLSKDRPYGFGSFSESGVLLNARFDRHVDRDNPTKATSRLFVDVTGAYYPAAMDVRSAFGSASVGLGSALVLPLPTHPILNTRAGGKKLWGDFPFFEAATIGGLRTTRFIDTQRYAGDASLYGTTELLVPLVRFKLMIPAQGGIVGEADAGRVYVDGQSPGGWHSTTGEGIWVGRVYGSQTLTVLRTTEPGHAFQVRLGLSF